MTSMIEGGLNATLMQPGKALVICGSAASGKTILAEMIISQYANPNDIFVIPEFNENSLKNVESVFSIPKKVIICTRLSPDHFTDRRFVTLTIK